MLLNHFAASRLLGAVALSGAWLSPAPVAAETIEEFYKGKTIAMYVGTGESSGAVGAYPRSISQIIKKYIPGNPTVIVSNMPGAGGIKAANFIYSLGPQDGTAWGFITRGFLLAPLLKYPQADFDPTRFNWIGSPARTVSVGTIWTANTAVRSIEDARKTEVVVGATSAGQDTGIFPAALNKYLGTRFKIVTGYKSVGEVDLAMEKGEVQGKIGSTWNSLNSGRSQNWVKDKTVTVLVQLGVAKAHDIPPEVPLALDLVSNETDRQVLQVLCGPSATGYPSFMGPGVPADRVTAIRAAYVAALKDPEFIELMKKQSLDLDPISAEELTRIVKDIYALPAAAVEQARLLLPPG
jgi:tripartite-type tricarboxylate transporter receptor subunit TctC